MKSKKNSIFLVIMLMITTILVACEKKEEEKFIEEKDIVIESIEFKNDTHDLNLLLQGRIHDKVIINTDTETLVMYLQTIKFYKTNNDESTLNLKKRIKKSSINFKDDVTAEIFIDPKNLKEISRKYAELYSETLDLEVPGNHIADE